MDIRVYFRKIREIERAIREPYVVVVSLDTPEGGRAGCLTQVSRAAAAHLIADLKARLADEAETAAFHQSSSEALAAAEEERLAGKIQLTVVSDHLNRHLRSKAGKD